MIDFEEAEFQLRTEKVQKIMFEKEFDAILLCTEPEVRYFTGFRSLFWQSPTRPWFVVIPKNAEDDFKQISLNAFLNSEDDADVDWEDYFGLK